MWRCGAIGNGGDRDQPGRGGHTGLLTSTLAPLGSLDHHGGPRLRVDFGNGAASSGDSGDWAVRWTWLDRGGAPTTMVVRYDKPADADGFVMQVNHFRDGDLRTSILHDVVEDARGHLSHGSDLHDWRMRVVTYGEDRRVLTQTEYYDNDAVRRVMWAEDGSRVAVHLDGEIFGGADNFDWRSKREVVGADGLLREKHLVEDDGDLVSFWYVGGEVAAEVFVDVADQHDWYARLIVREADGSGWETQTFDSAEALAHAMQVVDVDFLFA